MSASSPSLTIPWELVCVLAAYRAAEQERAASGPASDDTTDAGESHESDDAAGWVPRLTDVPGVPAEQLSQCHGRLIAEGLLRFQLLNREAGVGYRLTPEGRAALQSAGDLPNPDDDDALDRF